MITVILNAFRRQDALREQIDCLYAQSMPPEKIMIWNNGDPLNPDDFDENIVIVNSSENFGVWARFAFAINAETEFVCMLDDDTMPAPKFFENCLNCMRSEEALLGARGLRFHSKRQYHPFDVFGWDGPNENVETVDIVGHAWFFKREWLSVYWRELPQLGTSRYVGEDMHFSHMLQKYLGVKTMVPPHPIDDQTLWGSKPTSAFELGTQSVAISQKDGAMTKFDQAISRCTRNGFKLYFETEPSTSKSIVIGTGLTRMVALRKFLGHFPFLERLARRLVKLLAKFNIYL